MENKFDLVLLDISMPGKNGLQTLKEIKKYDQKLPILMLSMHAEEQYAMRAIKAGASGYLTKDSASDQLVKAIKKIYTQKAFKIIKFPLFKIYKSYIFSVKNKN